MFPVKIPTGHHGEVIKKILIVTGESEQARLENRKLHKRDT